MEKEKTAMKKIAIIGEVLVEIMAEKKNQTFSEHGTWLGPYASGAPAIFINQACALGAKGTIWGAVGDDDFGRLCLEHLQYNNVDTSHIKKSASQSTGVAFVKYEESGEREFIYHIDNSASGDMSIDDINADDLRDISYFHVMGSSIFNEDMIAIHEKIFAYLPKKVRVSLDPNIRVEILQKSPALTHCIVNILSKAHMLITTEDELRFLIDKENAETSIHTIWDLFSTLSVLIIKKGARGACLYTREGEEYCVSALKVDEVDSTGAGDSFAGAFIAALSLEYSYKEALEIANIVGAHAVMKQGPMEGCIGFETIQQFL